MAANRAGRDAYVDRCPECGSWRLRAICHLCASLATTETKAEAS